MIIIAVIIISFIAIEAGVLSPRGSSSDDVPSIHHYYFGLIVNDHYQGHYVIITIIITIIAIIVKTGAQCPGGVSSDDAPTVYHYHK